MEYIIAAIWGIISGIIVGMTPGVGMSLMLVIMTPTLMTQPVEMIVMFYAAMATTTQYFGSIATIYFGFPGENTSTIIVPHRKQILEQGLLKQFIKDTALSSLICGTIASIVLVAIVYFFTTFSAYLKSYVLLVAGTIGLLFACMMKPNQIWLNVAMVISGWFVAKIGYDPITRDTFGTFGFTSLYSGIPTFPVIVGLMGIGSLYSIFSLKAEQMPKEPIDVPKPIQRSTIVNGSIVGSVMGMIPYIGNTISSYASYVTHRGTTYNKLIAAEGANNAANVTVLIPLLCFGIAISASELILLDIISLSNNYIRFSPEFLFDVVVVIFITLIICFFIANKGARPLAESFIKYHRYLLSVATILMIGTIWHIGHQSNQEMFYLTTLIVFSIIGLVLNRTNVLPFVYAFMLQQHMEQNARMVWQIYL